MADNLFLDNYIIIVYGKLQLTASTQNHCGITAEQSTNTTAVFQTTWGSTGRAVCLTSRRSRQPGSSSTVCMPARWTNCTDSSATPTASAPSTSSASPTTPSRRPFPWQVSGSSLTLFFQFVVHLIRMMAQCSLTGCHAAEVDTVAYGLAEEICRDTVGSYLAAADTKAKQNFLVKRQFF